MASACVNNIGVVPDNFRNIGWLSPRISFGRDSKIPDSLKPDLGSPAKDSPAGGDFEFCLHDDPVTMLPADELFSDGKLVPLHFPKPSTTTTTTKPVAAEDDVSSPEKEKASRLSCYDGINNGADQYMFSPKAPRCSSRWREFLGLKNKKLSQNATLTTTTSATVKTSSSVPTTTSKSIRHFLQRNSRMSKSSLSSSTSSADPSLSLPLLHHRSSDSSIDCESTFSISSSSRLSLSSSSSSGHEHEDLPRLSLDDKPREPLRSFSRPRVRLVRPRMVPVENPNPKPLIDHPSAPNVACRTGRSPMRRQQDPAHNQTRGVSVDSPRMNPSGKIVFQSLERSSSSPSTFNGGPRYKYRGMERSYSANVRVTPVLNVPVCSLRGSSKSGGFGFGQLFSSSTSSGQRREKESSSNNGGIGGSSRNYHQHHNHRRKESS